MSDDLKIARFSRKSSPPFRSKPMITCILLLSTLAKAYLWHLWENPITSSVSLFLIFKAQRRVRTESTGLPARRTMLLLLIAAAAQLAGRFRWQETAAALLYLLCSIIISWRKINLVWCSDTVTFHCCYPATLYCYGVIHRPWQSALTLSCICLFVFQLRRCNLKVTSSQPTAEMRNTPAQFPTSQVRKEVTLRVFNCFLFSFFYFLKALFG